MDDNEIIQVPQSIVCTNLNALINRIYLGIGNPRAQDKQFNPNAEVHMLRSVDSVSEEDRMHYAYLAEFLQQLNADGLPPALLYLKVGSPVILLRNLNPGEVLKSQTDAWFSSWNYITLQTNMTYFTFPSFLVL